MSYVPLPIHGTLRHLVAGERRTAARELLDDMDTWATMILFEDEVGFQRYELATYDDLGFYVAPMMRRHVRDLWP